MKHKYVLLAEISNDTLKEFQFMSITDKLPDFKFTITRHENLERIDRDENLQKSILMGICEVIVGTFIMHGKMPNKALMENDVFLTDVPRDFGYTGAFEADYSKSNTVRILNLFGCNKKNEII